MNYNFYADKSDKIDVLDFIFGETDLRIYDLGSQYGQKICEYKSTSELVEKFDLTNGIKSAVTLQLWISRHKGEPIFNRVNLNPKQCNGHTYRYSTNGWGMIQLYFGGIVNEKLNYSHIGHFNELGALKKETLNHLNGKVDLWDWTEIQKTSRKLKYIIHNRLSTRKIGSFGVLPGADKLEKRGIQLI